MIPWDHDRYTVCQNKKTQIIYEHDHVFVQRDWWQYVSRGAIIESNLEKHWCRRCLSQNECTIEFQCIWIKL